MQRDSLFGFRVAPSDNQQPTPLARKDRRVACLSTQMRALDRARLLFLQDSGNDRVLVCLHRQHFLGELLLALVHEPTPPFTVCLVTGTFDLRTGVCREHRLDDCDHVPLC